MKWTHRLARVPLAIPSALRTFVSDHDLGSRVRPYLVLIAIAFSAGGCSRLNIENGQLRCSVPAQQCPGGYHCASDGTCWQNGQDPPPTSDMSPISDGDMSMTTSDMADPTGDMTAALCTFALSSFNNCRLAP